MTDEEIDQAVSLGAEALEMVWLERGHANEEPEMRAEQAQLERLGQYAKALRDQNARLHEIAQAVAHADLCDGVCWSCYMMPPFEQHTPDCVITKAKEALQ